MTRFLALSSLVFALLLLAVPALYAQTLTAPQQWYVRGNTYVSGVCYNVEPDAYAPSALSARKDVEKALRCVLEQLGRDPAQAPILMKNISLTAASYATKPVQEVWRDGPNYVVVVKIK